jgi:hypothetical protein
MQVCIFSKGINPAGATRPIVSPGLRYGGTVIMCLVLQKELSRGKINKGFVNRKLSSS